MASGSRTDQLAGPAHASAGADAPLGRDVWIVAGVVVLWLSEVESHGGIDAPIAFGPILAGLVLLALFARHAWHAQRPLIDVRLFAHRCFRPAAVAVTLAGAALFGSILVIALYFQLARGESALDTGLLTAPQGLGAAAVMPLAGRLTDRVGGGHVAAVGFALLAVGTLLFATHELAIAQPRADAFGTTFWWAVGISAVAIVPAAVLAWRERAGLQRADAVAPPA